MAETAIEWATHVWNPVTGCSRVSPGCAHCYALTYAGRLKAMGQPKYQRDGGRGSGPGFGVTLHEHELEAPSTWRAPRRVFVNSMSDLFHEEVPTDFVAEVFLAMARAPQHTFMVLTKRADRMLDVLLELGDCDCSDESGFCAICRGGLTWPLPNVWLGVSIENRRFVRRADALRATPAAVRFISAEPLLGPLIYDDRSEAGHYALGGMPADMHITGSSVIWDRHWSDEYDGDELDLEGIDWLIVGGESGPKHRPIREEWVRDLRDACAAAGTAYFLKQWGGHTPKAGGRELDGRTWDELPDRMQDIEVARAPALAAVTANDEEG